MVRQAMLRWMAVLLPVMVAGFFVFPAAYWHRVWIVGAVAVPLWILAPRQAWRCLAGDRLLRMVFLWLVAHAAASLFFAPPADPGRAVVAPGDWLLLSAFVGAPLVLGPSNPGLARRLLLASLAGAVAAAVASIPLFSLTDWHGFAVGRLRNVFVLPGWLNPVWTGLLFGMGAVAAAGLQAAAATWVRRSLLLAASVLLFFAVFLTWSRSALLATASGLLAGMLVIPLRRSWLPAALFLAVALVFHLFFVQERTIVDALVERGDTGRLRIYRAILGQLDSPLRWLTGVGYWAPEGLPAAALGWHVAHPHSIFVTALYRGGLAGLAVLAVFVTGTLRQAWRLARGAGHPLAALPLMLCCYGLAGLAFEGNSAFSMMAGSRFEPLLVLFPAILARLLAAGKAGPAC